MNKLILFCVETTKKANTDYLYISETIKRFYGENNKIVRRPVYMQSRTRYKDRATTSQIEKFRKSFPNDNITVIYCIDVDDYDTSPTTKKLLDEIKRYCNENHYEFIFFCRDVEDVYWGKRANKNEKVQKAASFKETKRISTIEESQLRKSKYAKNSSNILNVLDQCWTR